MSTDFPSNFRWGVATAAYQIEGASDEDGRGASIWDCFSSIAGNIKDGSDGRVACDHYHRWQADCDLIAQLNVNAYRFSIAWPRILPEGTGPVNEQGLDFYDRLVDGLLERGIEPCVTLYHWDLPLALQGNGGWANRATIDAFLQYTDVVTRRLGDRVKLWITHNEPRVAAVVGNIEGRHAPGIKDVATAVQVAHHLLLSHGLAVPIIRANSAAAEVGITLDLIPPYPATDSPTDQQAATQYDLITNRWFLDPIFGRGYPVGLWDTLGATPTIAEHDMAAIAVPTDFLGINFYRRQVVRSGAGGKIEPVIVEGARYTEMGWEVYAPSLTSLLEQVNQEYAPAKIYITENGAAFADQPADGSVNDVERTEYLETHLAACSSAIKAGVPLAGYFLWSLMDNFEWGHGYTKRFGVVYVDYANQKRTLKHSGEWYRQFVQRMRTNVVELNLTIL